MLNDFFSGLILSVNVVNMMADGDPAADSNY